jgi:pimeloyl-ACP methyl ester carboxylesterase
MLESAQRKRMKPPAPPKAKPKQIVEVPKQTVEVIDPRWLFKAFSLALLVAFCCGYLTLCYLFWQGQWQLVLHPSRTVASTPASAGLAFQPIRFGVDATGQPQLTGWWVPSDSSADPTVLLLHGGTGSMGDRVDLIRALHDVRLNVLVFDYAGFGASGGAHPTEALMDANTDAAFQYLTRLHGVAPGSLIVYGQGVGGALAVKLCTAQPAIEALILESPDGDFMSRVQNDPRGKIMPVSLLFDDNFPLAGALHTLSTPKLLISHTDGHTPVDLARAADPKITVEIPSHADAADFHNALRRFLDSYTVRAPGVLHPN